MIVIRYGAGTRTATIKGETWERNGTPKAQDDYLIRLVKHLTFGDRK